VTTKSKVLLEEVMQAMANRSGSWACKRKWLNSQNWCQMTYLNWREAILLYRTHSSASWTGKIVSSASCFKPLRRTSSYATKFVQPNENRPTTSEMWWRTCTLTWFQLTGRNTLFLHRPQLQTGFMISRVESSSYKSSQRALTMVAVVLDLVAF